MNNKLVLITILAVVIVVAGYLVYQSSMEKEKVIEESLEIEQPSVSEVNSWKTYRSEEYGFEFEYPATWVAPEDTSAPFLQLLVADGKGRVKSIAGSIQLISKEDSAYYKKMFFSEKHCPEIAGEIDFSSPTQMEAYVFCLTGDDIETNAGVWKGAVECSTTYWYGMEEDPNFCPHQFWIDTESFFYVVHFNFFEPIEENSEEAIFFDRFLEGFSFFKPTN